jgi:hypothetical protein
MPWHQATIFSYPREGPRWLRVSGCQSNFTVLARKGGRSDAKKSISAQASCNLKVLYARLAPIGRPDTKLLFFPTPGKVRDGDWLRVFRYQSNFIILAEKGCRSDAKKFNSAQAFCNLKVLYAWLAPIGCPDTKLLFYPTPGKARD